MEFDGFQVYDVEPPAVPDVLAERPVMVFGKWKGEHSGKIGLSGISADRPYSASIDAGSVVPSPANSALRYLWARHRIAVLSDYEKLSRDDTRIQEITQMGLDYNLLTEYTAFVAIDSQTRNVDGKSTTIKQPLPLPQGVSDLAVAGSRTRYALSPVPSGLVSNMGKDVKSSDAGPDTKSRVKVLADHLLISGNLSKSALEKFIQEHLKEIQGCYSGIKNPGSGKFSVKMDMDGSGRVLKAETGIDEINNRQLKSCILRMTETWTLPAPSDGKPASVEVFFEF
jgi:Ca-activated chloride channel family protein